MKSARRAQPSPAKNAGAQRAAASTTRAALPPRERWAYTSRLGRSGRNEGTVRVELGHRTRGLIAGLGVALLLLGALFGAVVSGLRRLVPEVPAPILAGWTLLCLTVGFFLGVASEAWVCAQ